MPGTRLGAAPIQAARRVTDPVSPGTPLYRCEALERALGCSLSIKPGTANPVRSFKARGTEVAGSPATAPRAVAGGSNVDLDAYHRRVGAAPVDRP